MQDDLEVGDGLLDRQELEIELAHFALRLARRMGDSAHAATVGAWIQDEATALILRVMPKERPRAGDRVRQLAQSLAGVDVQVAAASYGLKLVPSGDAPAHGRPTGSRTGPTLPGGVRF